MLEFHIFTSAKLSFHCVSFSSDEFFRYLFRLKLYIYLTNDKHARNIWNFQFSSPVVCSSDEMISLLYTENSERHGARKKKEKKGSEKDSTRHTTQCSPPSQMGYIYGGTMMFTWYNKYAMLCVGFCSDTFWFPSIFSLSLSSFGIVSRSTTRPPGSLRENILSESIN